MGVDSNHYVGPFFKCHCPVTKVPKSYPACVTEGCRLRHLALNGTAKFCNECGKALGTIEKGFEKVRAVRDFDVMEATGERLYAPGSNYGPLEKTEDSETHCYISNVYIKNPILRDGNKEPKYNVEEGDSIYSFGPNWTPEADKNFLRDNFAKEYALLSNLYGDENVEVCWGILNYHS